MNALKIFSVALILFCGYGAQSQTNWSLRTGPGIASENNLGDTGLRLSSKISRHFGRWSGFAQAGVFQMLRSNESWTGDEGYRNHRSLSTTNLDLGGSFAFIDKSRIRLSADAGGTCRIGRQLWPEFSQTVNGHREDFYTFEKISEIGYLVSVDFSVKASERLWVSLDVHSHNYTFFGEYLGAGLGITINL